LRCYELTQSCLDLVVPEIREGFHILLLMISQATPQKLMTRGETVEKVELSPLIEIHI